MIFSTRGFITVAFLALLGEAAVAQEVSRSPIDSGTLIRVHVAGAGSMRGRVLTTFAPGSSVLTFCRYPGTPCADLADPRVQTLPSTEVTEIDVAHGSKWLTGAAIGGFVGGAVGVLGIVLAHGFCDTSTCTADADHRALGALVIGVGVGAAFGAAAPEWRPVP